MAETAVPEITDDPDQKKKKDKDEEGKYIYKF